MVLCALSIFGIVVLIATELVRGSHLSWTAFGFRFFFSVFVDPDTKLPMYWDPVNGHFSALPFVLARWFLRSWRCCLRFRWPLAWPCSSPRCARAGCAAPLAFLTELLAAIPSVIYGLWAVFILVPLLREHVNPWLIKLLGWTGFFNDDNPPAWALWPPASSSPS
jgi:phosphate transport system permease protein